jgi:hypothetical protein
LLAAVRARLFLAAMFRAFRLPRSDTCERIAPSLCEALAGFKHPG